MKSMDHDGKAIVTHLLIPWHQVMMVRPSQNFSLVRPGIKLGLDGLMALFLVCSEHNILGLDTNEMTGCIGGQY